MRPGQQHNKRGRSRSRHRSSGGGGGGSGGGGGGNPLSRVYESNGPDVKVRGTPQTVAEKYLQLGRDAQSAGDIVMAESYYQYAEHYLRIVAAAQESGQQAQQQFRRPGEEFDDEDGEDGSDNDGDEGQPTAAARPQAANPQGSGEQPDIQGEPPEFENERPPQQNFRQPREFRDRDQQGNRDQQGQQKFRPRWQDRRDRPANGEPREQTFQPRNEDQPREAREAPAVANGNVEEASGQWEAPSFLRRPAPLPPVEADGEEAPVAAKRPRLERKPRRDAGPDAASPAPEAPTEPQVD